MHSPGAATLTGLAHVVARCVANFSASNGIKRPPAYATLTLFATNFQPPAVLPPTPPPILCCVYFHLIFEYFRLTIWNR